MHFEFYQYIIERKTVSGRYLSIFAMLFSQTPRHTKKRKSATKSSFIVKSNPNLASERILL